MSPPSVRPAAATPRRRAYALPLVMLLALVGSIVATMIIEFQGLARLGETRQIETLRSHHQQQGIAEIIELFARFPGREAAQGRPLPSFQISGEHGEIFRIQIVDAQGTLLESPVVSRSGDPDEPGDGGELELVLQRAAEEIRATSAEPERFLRKRGPARVNVNAASATVLEALALAVAPRADPRGFAAMVALQRAERPLDAAGLVRAIGEAGIDDRDAALRLQSLFVTTSSLFEVDALVIDPVRRTRTHHRGLILGEVRESTGSAGARAPAASSQPWAFLTWESVPEAWEQAGDGAGR